MKTDDRKYVRVYYSIQDDPKFDRVRGNLAALGAWLRLLMAADAVWPASADLPRGIRGDLVKLLADVELVDLLPEHRYRIHGLDTERGMRSQSARNAAALRWHSEGNAEAMPSKAEPSKRLDETVPVGDGRYPPIGSRKPSLVKPSEGAA